MAQSGPPRLSPDGLWYWDGAQWQPLLSPDASHRWNGAAWVPVTAPAALPPPPAPSPPPQPQIELPPGPVSPWIAANYPQLNVVSSFCCYIGLIWAAFDGRKQGWHDKIAGTVVVLASGR